jgi:hypothetical protein
MTTFDPSEDERLQLEFCRFPKYPGVPWITVVEEDPSYVSWLISGEGPEMSDDLYEYLSELLEDSEY